MTKDIFLSTLEESLAPMPPADRAGALAYYQSLFHTAEKTGETEAAVLAKLPPPKDVAADILASYMKQSHSPYEASPTHKNRNWVLIALIVIIAGPILFGVGTGLFAVFTGVFVGLFTVVVGVGATGLGLLASGVAGLVLSVVALFNDVGFGLLTAGASFIAIGLGILFIRLIILVAQWLVALVKEMLQFINRRWRHGRAA